MNKFYIFIIDLPEIIVSPSIDGAKFGFCNTMTHSNRNSLDDLLVFQEKRYDLGFFDLLLWAETKAKLSISIGA